MPRKRNELKSLDENYNKAFPTVMRKLMQRTTQADLAGYLSKTRQSITYYCDGSSSPDWETIVKIANYFNVSTDYLLGITDEPSKQPCAADDLGLSPQSIAYIRQYSNPGRSKDMEELVRPDDCLDGLSMLIESGHLLAIAGETKRLSRLIRKSNEVSEAFMNSSLISSDGDMHYYKYKQAIEEDLLAKHIQKEIEETKPALQGEFAVLVGRHIIEYRKRLLIDAFEEMIRDVTNYDDFKKHSV